MGKTVLKELGWSEEAVARAVGCSRPTYHKYTQGGGGLTLEQRYKLESLEELAAEYRQFQQEAVDKHIFELVHKPAYHTLSQIHFSDATPSKPNTKEEKI